MRRRLRTLEEVVKERVSRGAGKYEVLREVYREWVKGSLKLVDPEPPKDFAQYISRPDYSLWLWAIAALVGITAASIMTSSYSPVIYFIRYLAGLAFTLYIPGAVLTEVIYPREDDLSPLERLALSLGLSLAVLPLIGLMVSYTPWGFRLWTLIPSLSIYSLGLAFIAAYRKYRVLRVLVESGAYSKFFEKGFEEV